MTRARIRLVVLIALTVAIASCGSSGNRTSAETQANEHNDEFPNSATNGTATQGSEDSDRSENGDREQAETVVYDIQLAEVEMSPYVAIFGDVDDVSLPEGERREVSVVSQGEVTAERTIPVIVHNRVSADIKRAVVTYEYTRVPSLEDNGGDPDMDTHTGGYGRMLPHVVASHEIAFGYVYFGDDSDIPDSEDPAFLVDYIDNYDSPWSEWVPVTVSDAMLNGTHFSITLTNQDERPITYLVVLIMCLDASGVPFGHPDVGDPQMLLDERLAPGQIAAYTLDLVNLPDDCSRGLAAAVANQTG
jgi:hypothetical protein